MIQTILIVLVAVVVLIVIIAVLALRYLRADDSDTFDEIPDEPRRARRPAGQDRDRQPAPPERRPRQSEQVTEMWAADRPAARAPDNRAPAGFRDRDTGARPPAPQRAASQAAPRRQPVGSRSARAGTRPDGPDSSTSSWDSLSDVDYWAELAADKPEITPPDSRPAAPRPGARGESDQLPVRKRHQQSRPSQPSRLSGAPSARMSDAGQTEQIDVRAAQAAAARYNGDAAASSPDVLGRHSQQRPAASQRPDAPATQQQQRPSSGQRPAGQRPAQQAPAAQPGYQSRPPAPVAPPYSNGHGRADDDPLTSPSFPAVNTADSRSYRTRRSNGNGNGQPGANGQHTRPAAAQSAPSHQFIDYSSAPRRSTSQPDGYPVQPAALSARTPEQPPSRAAEHQSPVAPAANPYGSYVSQPQPAYSEAAHQADSYRSAGYQETPAPSLAAAAYGGYGAGQHAGSAGWYAAPATPSGSQPMAQRPGQPADGYLPAAGLGGTGGGGASHVANGSPARGYAGIDYSNLRYDDPVYPDAPAAPPGYGSAGQHEQQGYGTADSGTGQDAYRGYPGYTNGGR